MITRTVFMGTPEFAVPVLEAISKQQKVIGVVTQPDRPAGRGNTLTPPPVKVAAETLGLPVIQPRRLREPEAMEQLHAWNPEMIVVAAFGQILRPAVLDLPEYGCINVHASLLPRWRGAAPINAAILHGDPETGISIMKMDPGIDTGPVLAQKAIPIHPDDTAVTLGERLALLGAELLVKVLPGYLAGEILPQPQDESLATYAPMLKKEDGLLNFEKSAEELVRQVRAYQPWPGAYTLWQGQILKVHKAQAADTSLAEPGENCVYQGLPAVQTSQGLLVLKEVQPAGKKPMPGEVFLRGAHAWAASS